MNNTKYKTKRFLLPILSFVLILIFSISAIGGYITINLFKTHMNEDIEQTKKEYTEQHKNRVYKEVNFVNESIEFQITKIENKLKISLKEKVNNALNIATYTYNKYKNTHNKEEIKEEIAKALEIVKFNDNRGYYFMYDNKTKVIFGHPLKKFIGKDMTNFRDVKGQSLMALDTEALSKDKIGFSKIYFTKPNNQTKEFPKITCITKFEPLDLVLGIGEYLDVIESQTKKYVLSRFSQSQYNDKDRYLIILDVHNKKGGDDFATVLLNSNRTDLVGKKVSDKVKDVKGNRFRKNFLDLVVEKGEGYSQYWYQKPSTKVPASKMSYFYLQKDWDWIIASGFYYEDLEKEIIIMKESINTHTDNVINEILIWVSLLSLLAILISVLVSLQIDKTIKNYTNKIIDYENNKREQEHVLMQQNKLASMGEMIGNIAHQWRQPLSIISMGSTGIIMEKEFGTLDDDTLIKNCNAINNNAQYLSKTIDDFKNFIKGDRTKKSFLLTDDINSFFHLIEGTIKKNDITLVLELDDEIEIIGYENELTQCFINIFNNARDALVENKVDNKLIFILTSRKDDKAIIKIKDNAGGIPKEILTKIFEPYFTTKHKSLGTGIGLHMTYNLIVEGTKGSITADNVQYEYEENEYIGAEFTITLPIS